MSVLYILVGSCLLLNALTLFAVIFLSNSLFRMFLSDRQTVAPPPSNDKGLLDLPRASTYDPRFSSSPKADS